MWLLLWLIGQHFCLSCVSSMLYVGIAVLEALVCAFQLMVHFGELCCSGFCRSWNLIWKGLGAFSLLLGDSLLAGCALVMFCFNHSLCEKGTSVTGKGKGLQHLRGSSNKKATLELLIALLIAHVGSATAQSSKAPCEIGMYLWCIGVGAALLGAFIGGYWVARVVIRERNIDHTLLKFRKLKSDVIVPMRGSAGAAGLDLSAIQSVTLEPHSWLLLKTGL